ncbi:MAG: phosphoglycerate kinase [Candidatus Diapherotrites archaeon]|uniref:Phosphoglycerate kinase n=1 Tax=Candidatus Iainarchaeum sp. TaxID=3101447 RepID=A0A8T4L8I3_9ARCH|nr:phosphoglycerate kinase [Candidatus Diapherotrites archaeon]
MYRTILDQSIAGKTLIVRIDLNSNFQNGKLQVSERFIQHAKALSALADKGARVVVLAHQGRKGDPDFFPLESHGEVLEKLMGRKVKLVPWNVDYVAEVKRLNDGEVILMQNVREFAEESREAPGPEHAQLPFVKNLASVADFFVLDALSIAHRSHASVVGFSALLPSFAGPTLHKELSALQKISSLKDGRLLILGGAKPADSIAMLSYFLDSKKTDRVLLAGVLAEVFLKTSNFSFGKKDFFLQEKGYLKLLPVAKDLFSKHRDKIVLPLDFAVLDDKKKRVELLLSQFPSSNPTMDIGKKTIALFSKEIKKSRLIVFNGTIGVFEQKGFEAGTKKIFSAICRNKAFSLIGGGDTVTAAKQLKFSFERFGHVSLAGKALLEYLSGQTLPGLAALGFVRK